MESDISCYRCFNFWTIKIIHFGKNWGVIGNSGIDAYTIFTDIIGEIIIEANIINGDCIGLAKLVIIPFWVEP